MIGWTTKYNGGMPDGRRLYFLDTDGDSAPPPPDYGPMAQASKESAEIMAALGREQLAETKRQYDINRAVAEPVAQAQLGLMRQQQTQGDDYYNYMRDNFRPLEQSMIQKAGVEMSDARAEEAAAQAAADARRGSTQATNQMVRQGLRYGYSPAKLAAMAGQMAGSNASNVAGAMTTARNNQRNIGWARGMDAAGLGRNLTGASQGAYGLSLGAGNAAVNNTMQPGNQLLTGMNQGAGTIGQGRSLYQSGLGNILSAQTSAFNAGQSAAAQGGLDIGNLMRGGAALYTAFNTSDRRLKEDIIPVGVDDTTGLNLYEFSYLNGDGSRFRGVMADEVLEVMPEAVLYGDDGFAMVDYGKLGIQFERV